MTASPSSAVVRLLDVSRRYGEGSAAVTAVAGATWDIGRGGLYALRGRSGSGKTTLLNLIGGLDVPTEGRVVFDGDDLGALSEDELAAVRRRSLGFVFQTFALLPVLSARENVELALRVAGAPSATWRERTLDVLRLVGLESRVDHRPFELSGGEQQRVAIARAIANRPDVLLADEPTGELDSNTGLEIMLLFRHIVAEEGVTAVVATHDPALSQIADQTVVMRDGHLAEAEGPLDFDLPDLIQHVEIVDPATVRPASDH